MSGPSVYLTWPTRFTPIPASLPPTLPPPVKERTFRSPFGIDKDLFNFALEPWLPVTFAAAYITTVFLLNAYNRQRDHKPWWIARQRAFNWFVVLHNVLLCIYSTATFAAMLRAITHTLPDLRNNPNGAAGIADALCKIHGPRGLGDAATYNTTINIWEVKNTAIRLGYDGNPDPTDVGRLWNEGLAFWGWIFYISKFYEVVDTLIILSKGKRSATLQTYHHAGAMLCMWAGIRYMSPPIWMFVFINSFIHAMMYLYFSLSALGYRVPQGLKRLLTSLQIAQFVFGASYAAIHLFVKYDIPINTPYQVATIVERAVSSVSSVADEATSTVSSLIATPTARDMGAFIKKMLLRAAGEEGVAERVRGDRNQILSPKIEQKIERFNEQTFETRWRTEWTTVDCIDTTGEAFAIYLNLLYLAPLTALFGRFFFKAYTQRGKARTARKAAQKAAEAAKQAEKETERYIEEHGEKIEEEIAERGPDAAEKIRKQTESLHDQLRKDVEEMKQGKFKGSRRVSDRVASYEGKAKEWVGKAKEQGQNAIDRVKEEGKPYVEKGQEVAEQAKEEGKKLVNGNSGKNGSKGSTGNGGKGQKNGQPQSKDDAGPEKSDSSTKPEPNDDDAQARPKRQANEATSQPSKAGGGKGSEDEAKQSESGEPLQDEDKENQPPQSSSQSAPSNSKPSDSKQGSSSDTSKPKNDRGDTDKPKDDASSSNPASDTEGGAKPASKDDSKDDAKSSASEPDSKPKDDTKDRPLGSGTNNEPEEKQEANLDDSTAIRPGADVEESGVPDGQNLAINKKGGDEEDTDAMGKSGVNVDREDDDDKKKEGEDESIMGDDPTAGAEPAGEQWKSPDKTEGAK